MRIYTLKEGWTALENNQYKLASHIWLALMPEAQDVGTLTLYQHAYAASLMASHQLQEAAALYQEIYDTTRDGLALHQLGYISRQMGQPETAKAHFLAEQISLQDTDCLALSLNAYQLGRLASDHLSTALTYARLSVDYAQRAHCSMAEAFALCLLGQVSQVCGETETAQACFCKADHVWHTRPPNSLRLTQELRLIPLLLEGFRNKIPNKRDMNVTLEPTDPVQTEAPGLKFELKTVFATPSGHQSVKHKKEA